MMLKRNESGAVSLFVVIFAMLLITIVTVGFMRLMMGEVRQASDTDLSNSAYDSAMAGVEDAKRALLRYSDQCILASAANCGDLNTAMNSNTCNLALSSAGVLNLQSGESLAEVPVRQGASNDNSLEQAYTCVTITSNTDDFIGEGVPDGKSKLVPLVGTAAIGRVQIKWFSKADMTTPVDAVNLTNSATKTLPRKGNWPQNRPSILRAQLIQYGSEFELNEFDYVKGSTSNTNTLFLYPTSNGQSGAIQFVGRDIRKSTLDGKPAADSASSSPQDIACEQMLSGGKTYACTATLILPGPIDGGNRTAFLRLTPFYKATSFQIMLQSPTGAPVQFAGVQPAVDSTGRANDMFRRVQARVELGDTTFPYPDAAVDVTTEFCKDFILTPSISGGTCNYAN